MSNVFFKLFGGKLYENINNWFVIYFSCFEQSFYSSAYIHQISSLSITYNDGEREKFWEFILSFSKMSRRAEAICVSMGLLIHGHTKWYHFLTILKLSFLFLSITYRTYVFSKKNLSKSIINVNTQIYINIIPVIIFVRWTIA